MMDYARLVHAAWDESGATIKVFGPSPIKDITTGYFGPNGVLAHDLNARTKLPGSQEVWVARGGTIPRPWPAPEVQEITAGNMIKGEEWNIQFTTAPHAQPYLECLALALTHQNKKFVYSGDAGLCPEIETLAKNADLLLHWCYRLDGEQVSENLAEVTPTPSEIGAMAKRVGVHSLILTHFRKHMDDPAHHEQAIKNGSEAFGKTITIAEDLQQFEI